MQMNGIAGIAGWRWIFIMEGVSGVDERNPPRDYMESLQFRTSLPVLR